MSADPADQMKALLAAAERAAVALPVPSVLRAAPSHRGADLLRELRTAGWELARIEGASPRPRSGTVDLGVLGWLALAAALSFGVLAVVVSPVYFLPTGVNATTAYFARRMNRRHHDSR